MSSRLSVNDNMNEPLLRSETKYQDLQSTPHMQGWEKYVVRIGYNFDCYLMEFIGTLFLVTIIGVNAEEDVNPFAPITIAFGLAALVFLGGHISGAHYNPAVTLGEFLSGRVRISLQKVLGYFFAQFAGGLFGALLIWALTGHVWTGPSPGPDSSIFQAFLAEYVWTCLLVLVVLNCATVKIRDGNSFFGLAIGFTVASGAFCVGPISGGGFNPAVASAGIVLSGLAKKTTLKYIWIYLLAPVLGSVTGAFVFRLTNPREYDREAMEIAM